MTIRYIYILAGALAWLYVLGVLFLKMLLDYRRRSLLHRRQQEIRVFFTNGGHEGDKGFGAMQAYTEDGQLFDYICECYLRRVQEQPQTDGNLDFCMKRLLHHRIAEVEHADAAERCRLLRNISLCGLRSEKIDRFLSVSAEGVPLERLWAVGRTEAEG